MWLQTDKKYQLADWRVRPLPEELLVYARMDTHYLLFIYDSLKVKYCKSCMSVWMLISPVAMIVSTGNTSLHSLIRGAPETLVLLQLMHLHVEDEHMVLMFG